MKMKVDKTNGSVFYNDAQHKYWTKEGQNCISVTTLIHEFCQPFDEHKWSSIKAFQELISEEDFKKVKDVVYKNRVFDTKLLERFNITNEAFIIKKAEILQNWKNKNIEACERGSRIHKIFEDGHLAGDSQEIKKLNLGGTFKCYTDNILKPGMKGVYPELLIHRISDDGKLRIAGQADLIIIDENDIHVLDYKGLDLNTLIPTTKGLKKLSLITKNDVLYDRDGNETNILNISEIHHNPCYLLKFDNGAELIADHEHRWLIDMGVEEVVLETRELEILFNTNTNLELSINTPVRIGKVGDLVKNSKLSKVIINDIKPIPTVPTKCLEVDSPTHTFLAGEFGIPTHNTNQEIKKGSYYDVATKRRQMMKYPLTNIQDCNFYHYTLQLSTYAWMLQKIDPNLNVKSLTLIHIDHDNNTKFIECQYLKDDVERMLAFYKKQQTTKEQIDKTKPMVW